MPFPPSKHTSCYFEDAPCKDKASNTCSCIVLLVLVLGTKYNPGFLLVLLGFFVSQMGDQSVCLRAECCSEQGIGRMLLQLWVLLAWVSILACGIVSSVFLLENLALKSSLVTSEHYVLLPIGLNSILLVWIKHTETMVSLGEFTIKYKLSVHSNSSVCTHPTAKS